MKFLGRRNTQSNLIYINLEQATFTSPRDDEFTLRVAKRPDEVCRLLKVGFEYITYMKGAKIFRRQK